ncbi:esterase/lipase family protein [Salicibibacter halophilus]|nr:hypothetical protein [Salicibibacter halophilus]
MEKTNVKVLFLLCVFLITPSLAEGSDTGLDPPETVLSSSEMKTMVERFNEDGEFENEEAAHALYSHLSSVRHYEEQEETEKVMEAMEDFKKLLGDQQDNDFISEEAFNVLDSYTEDFMQDNDPESDAGPGTWYEGETPENVSEDDPVLLFVHGLDSSADTWFEDNDMYETAYEDGYQTAFIDLYPVEDNWDNGALLAEKIEQIYYHYDKTVVLIGHSKGGIDAQTALVHYDAHPYVGNVITLGSPHFGSQLADLAHSRWAGWLAELLDQRNNATYALQSGYMEGFRFETDPHPQVKHNDYYTLAGTSWGSFASPLFWGGLYLSFHGNNDGAVVTDDAYLPNESIVRIDEWDHQELNTGTATFDWFEPFLNESSVEDDATVTSTYDMERSNDQAGSDQLVRGGQHDGSSEEFFNVENDVNEISLDWISDQSVELEIYNPQGEEHESSVTSYQDNEFFKGGVHHNVHIDDPEPGEWRVQATSEHEGAYLATWHYVSPLSADVQLDVSASSMILQDESSILDEDDTDVSYHVDFIPEEGDSQQIADQFSFQRDSQEALTLPEVSQEGVYNITADIEGKDVDGAPFSRTIITTVFEDEDGNRFY